MKIDEIELLRLEKANLQIVVATQARDAIGAALLAKYGQPGETSLNVAPDGTIVRAVPLASVPSEAGQ